MDIRYPKLDWLTITGHYPSAGAAIDEFGVLDAHALAVSTADYFFLPSGRFVPTRPDRFYTWSFRHEETGMKFDVGREPWKQGWKLVISGSAMRYVSIPQRSFAGMVSESGYNVTRVDVAIDMMDLDVGALEIWDRYENLHKAGGARTKGIISSVTGATMYLGSRASQKMLRVYDKGKQMRTPQNWLRCEIEYKGDSAAEALASYADVPEVFYGALANMLDIHPCPLSEELYKLAQFRSTVDEKTLKTPSERAYWWHVQVIPAFKRLLTEDPSLAGELLADLNQAGTLPDDEGITT